MSPRLAVLLCVAVGLLGCFGVYSKRAPQSPALPSPVKVAATGPYVHEGSSLVLPYEVAGVRLLEITRFDEKGYDIAAAYGKPPLSPTITLVIYPGPNMSYYGSPEDMVEQMDRKYLQQHLEEITASIERADASRKQRRDTALEGPLGIGVRREWDSQLPGFFGPEQASTDATLFLYRHRWWILARMSCPRSMEKEGREQVDAILAALAKGGGKGR